MGYNSFKKMIETRNKFEDKSRKEIRLMKTKAPTER